VPLLSHAVHGKQLADTSAQLSPTARLAVQVPCEQNSVAMQSASPWHEPPATRVLQVPTACASAGSALHDRMAAHGTGSLPPQAWPATLGLTHTPFTQASVHSQIGMSVEQGAAPPQ
jgi:hypothetical protein